MKYKTRLVDSAQAELRLLPRATAMMILRKFAELETNPVRFGTTAPVTALVSDPNVRRRRVGDHRVFYEIRADELVVLVMKVGHRSTVYRAP